MIADVILQPSFTLECRDEGDQLGAPPWLGRLTPVERGHYPGILAHAALTPAELEERIAYYRSRAERGLPLFERS